MNSYSQIEPLWVTTVSLAPGKEVKPHVHEYYYHLVYIIEGVYECSIGGKTVSLGNNTMLIAHPKESMGWRCTSDNPGKTYEVKFTVFDEDLRDDLSDIPSFFNTDNCTRILLDNIMAEAKHRDEEYQQYIAVYLDAMLNDIVRKNRVRSRKSHEQTSVKVSPAKLAAKYIEAHYGESISLQDISLAINFNKSYLSAAFKRETGDTINNYIYKIRAYKACELIAYSDLSLAEVSSITGFANEQHFNRVFKKYIGLPPGEYRDATPKTLSSLGKEPISAYNVEILPVRLGKFFEVDSATGSYRPKED